MNKKTIWALVIIIIIALGFSLGNNKKENSGEALRIGVIYSQTGAASDWGQRNLRAMQMAVDEINTDGGVNGKNIELVVEDGQTDPKSTVAAFHKLSTTNNVYAIVGDVWDFVTEPMIPLSLNYQKLLVSPTVTNIPFKSKSDYYFSVGHRTQSTEEAIAKFFDVNSEIKNTYVFCWNNGWGEANEKTFTETVAKKNIEIIGRDCAYFGDDYRVQATKAIAKNPDSIFVITADSRAVKALREQGYKGKLLTTSDLYGSVDQKQINEQYTKDLYVINWLPTDSFAQKYQDRYEGQYPINEAYNSYNLIKIIAEAYENNPDSAKDGIKKVVLSTGKGVIDFKNNDNINANRESAELFRAIPGFKMELVK